MRPQTTPPDAALPVLVSRPPSPTRGSRRGARLRGHYPAPLAEVRRGKWAAIVLPFLDRREVLACRSLGRIVARGTWGRFAPSSFQSESVQLNLECSMTQERVPIALFPGLVARVQVSTRLLQPGSALALAVDEAVGRGGSGWSRDAIFDAMSFAGARGHGGSIAGAAQAALRPLPARDSRVGAYKAGGHAPSRGGHHALGALRAVPVGAVRARIDVGVANQPSRRP